MFYKEPRVTLVFEDRMPESIPEEDIELLFPDEREDGKKCKVRIAPCVFASRNMRMANLLVRRFLNILSSLRRR